LVFEILLVLVYLVFMFGIPATTERVWIDSVSSVDRERRASVCERMLAIAAAAGLKA